MKTITIRHVVALICVVLVIAHAFFPQLQIDQTTAWLLVIAVVAFFLPQVFEILKQAKRLKTGPFEMELDAGLQDLVKKTEAAEKAVENIPPPESPAVQLPEDIRKRIGQSASDPRDLLLAISVEIEQKLRNISELHGIRPQATAQQIVRQLSEAKKIGLTEVYYAFLEFWEIRNMIVHGNSYRLTSKYLYETIELGLRVLKLLDYWRPPKT